MVWVLAKLSQFGSLAVVGRCLVINYANLSNIIKSIVAQRNFSPLSLAFLGIRYAFSPGNTGHVVLHNLLIRCQLSFSFYYVHNCGYNHNALTCCLCHTNMRMLF